MYVYSENYPDTYPFNIDQVNITDILFLRLKKEFFCRRGICSQPMENP